MSWAYRVMRRATGEKDEPFLFGIYEFYSFKDDGGRMRHPYTADPMDPHGKTLEELRSDLALMEKALSLPVLDWKNGKPIKD